MVNNGTAAYRKILVTLDFPPEPGGIQNYLMSIVTHTFSANDIVIAPAYRPSAVLYSDAAYPCRIIRIFSPFSRINKKLLLIPMLFYALWLRNKQQTPTVFFAGNIFAALILRGIQLLFPVTYHCYTYGSELIIPSGRNNIRKRVWKNVLAHAETLYYLSETTRKLLLQYSEKTTCVQKVPKIVLPGGTITSKTLPEDTINLLAVGRLLPHKGHATLLDAFTMLPNNKKYHLTIAGSGPQYEPLLSRIRRSGCSPAISLVPDADNQTLAALYTAAHIFIFPSIDMPNALEGFGIVLLEAMAYKCAIITSNCSASGDVFREDPQSAITVPAQDSQSLSRAIATLANDPELWRTLTHKATTLLRSQYVW